MVFWEEGGRGVVRLMGVRWLLVSDHQPACREIHRRFVNVDSYYLDRGRVRRANLVDDLDSRMVDSFATEVFLMQLILSGRERGESRYSSVSALNNKTLVAS